MNWHPSQFDVLVIGGGHAGVEAAWAVANLLASRTEPGTPAVGLVTLDPSKIGVMSCNPAIGGLAKGQIVREVDALGGLMGLVADATGIMFKMLNTSKGPAVRGPRCQSDKHAYAEVVQSLIASRPEIAVIGGAVERFVIEDGGSVDDTRASQRVTGAIVRLRDGELVELRAGAVVLTTGTFMRGLMHTGERRTPGGRHGEAPASAISDELTRLGFELGRLKTGTPPRLKRDTIDWGELPAQAGDAEPTPFSDLTATLADSGTGWSAGGLMCDRFPLIEQVECRQTSTTPEMHALIRDNLHRAPMYSGVIESAGPRYCPSIEDKVVRFADREQHGVFLEPESLRDDTIYCNGISTSLPADVQEQLVRMMPGCAHAEIVRQGYAVEYDMVRPHQIRATGETKAVAGLYLAGQINGTSGYEEAAAQGLVAGVNAARRVRGEDDWVLGRDEAYIGVLMDDLVTKTPVEPYRMFTSRAEHRLVLRADNAADRLTPIAERLGVLDATDLGRQRRAIYAARREAMDRASAAIDAGRAADGRPLAVVACSAGFGVDELRAALPEVDAPAGVWFTALAERRYAPYIRRQVAEVRRHAAMERKPIPLWMNYDTVDGLRSEARAALTRFGPATFGQAGRLEGVTPADLTLVAVHAKRGRPRGPTDDAAAPTAGVS